MKKVIISDFDASFYDDNYEENIKLVNKEVEDGSVFIIATGRPLHLLTKNIEGKGIKYSYLICSDGAVIFDKNHKIINIEPMTKSNIDISIELLKSCEYISDYLLDKPYEMNKEYTDDIVGVLGVPTDKNKARYILKELNTEDLNAYFSHFWVNILNKSCSKGNAIKKLIELGLIDKDKIITIGDNNNDISMNKEFKSYAIDTNHKKLNEISTYVVKSFKEAMENESNNN